ncbi:polyketide synthase dehydratase domain-containing protein, partial [Bradyrhizobium nitroreducens]|uniref:polyketide synthase dehydratase domain-containing protein n=1 Tax=Bradyrhizobium nitroreducens TaxID=709803 RepID=UPI001FE079E5
MHPSLMDGALQAGMGLMLGEQAAGKVALPFAVESVQALAPLTTKVWAVARHSRSSGPDSGVHKLDI